MDVSIHKVTVQWKQMSVLGNDGQERNEEKAVMALCRVAAATLMQRRAWTKSRSREWLGS